MNRRMDDVKRSQREYDKAVFALYGFEMTRLVSEQVAKSRDGEKEKEREREVKVEEVD